MARDPRTRDCGIKGCTRAEYGMGLCREHKPLVPISLGIACSAEIMTTSHEIAEKYARRAIVYAQAALDAVP